MNYGDYLRDLLKSKNVRLSRLTQDLSLGSRNVLYRLFDNYYSYEKTIALTDRIAKAVAFSPDEREQLYRLAKKRVVTRPVMEARDTLSLLFRETALQRPKTELYSVLDAHQEWRAQIFIENICSADVIDDIDLFLRTHTVKGLSITGLACFSGQEDQIARELFAVLLLSAHSCYTPWLTPEKGFQGIICLFEKDGQYRIYIHKHDTDTRFINEVCTDISKSLYEYYLRNITRRLRFAKPLKDCRDRVSDYPKYLKEYAIVSQHPSTAMDGSVGFAQIPFAYMMRMLKDAGYFGFPKENAFIQDIIETARWRCMLNDHFTPPHIQIFEKAQLNQFLKTGMACDHISGLPPLTLEERIHTIKCVIAPAEEQPPRRDYRFLKAGKLNRQLTLIHEHCLLSYKTSAGYTTGHYNVTVSHPRALAVLKDFIENVFMKDYVFSREESQQIMSKLLTGADTQ